jgi:hypothetical protein
MLMAIVKILIVTDADGGYGRTIPPTADEEFHLGEFVHVLETTSWIGFNLEIVKAHRLNASGSGADITSFSFAAHDLGQYDIIFLFGIARNNVNNLPDAEAAAIAR